MVWRDVRWAPWMCGCVGGMLGGLVGCWAGWWDVALVKGRWVSFTDFT